MDPRNDLYDSLRLVDSKVVFGDRKAGIDPLVPISNMHATRLEAKEPPEFPRRLQLCDRKVAWKLQEILEWIESRKRGTKPHADHFYDENGVRIRHAALRRQP
jgi:predicted DNA-binding transcriptional regulator AlpA